MNVKELIHKRGAYRIGHNVVTSVQIGKMCWRPEAVVHLWILLRGLGATGICAHGGQLSRVLLLLLLLPAILRRRL